MDGCLVVAGGWTDRGHTSSAELLNELAEGWAGLPDMPTPRANPAGAVVGGELGLTGGWQLSGLSQVQVAVVEILSLDP